jgi:hypothetical protein
MRLGRLPALRRPWLTSVLGVAVLLLVALASWAFASPVGSTPDDDYHLSSIWCGAGERAGVCTAAPAEGERVVPRDVAETSICYAFEPTESAECQGPDFGADPADVTTTPRSNDYDHLYPPVFYFVMSLFVGPNEEISVVGMRILNAVLFVGLATALFLLLPARRRPTLVVSLAITLVPLGMFLVPSTNPSSWAIMSAGFLWLALLGYFETEGRRKAALGGFAVVATVLGAGARADAAVYAGLAVTVVIILTFRRERAYLLSALLPVALVAIALAFYAVSGQARAGSTGLAPHGDDSTNLLSLAVVNFVNVPDLWVGVFGHWGLGWLDTALPAVVWVGGFGVFCAALAFGFANVSRRKLVAVILVFAVLWVFPTVLLVQTRALVGGYVQPRYIYPLVIIFAGLALLAARHRVTVLPRSPVLLGVVVLAGVHAVSLHTNIRRYVTGSDVGGFNLNDSEWWWHLPVPPMAVWAVGSLAFAGALVLAAWSRLRPAAVASDADTHPTHLGVAP